MNNKTKFTRQIKTAASRSQRKQQNQQKAKLTQKPSSFLFPRIQEAVSRARKKGKGRVGCQIWRLQKSAWNSQEEESSKHSKETRAFSDGYGTVFCWSSP